MSKTPTALVVNLAAGPGTGKSSTMGGVFSELKWRGVNCEQAPEFAKEKVWEGSTGILSNQIYVFGKQLHTIWRVASQVDVVITDSPLYLSLIYGKSWGLNFEKLVLETYHKFWNVNFFLERHKAYNPMGRMQTEDEARQIDVDIKNLLNNHGLPYESAPSGRESVQLIADRVISLIGTDKQKYK